MTSPKPGAAGAPALPDYAPVPRASLGPAVNEQGYYAGRVERNLYYVTDGVYQAAFLTTPDGVVLFDAPPTIGHNLRRAVDWAAVRGYLDAVAEAAGAPVIEKYTGVLGAVDVFAVPTTFSILGSMRPDLGYRIDVHP